MNLKELEEFVRSWMPEGGAGLMILVCVGIGYLLKNCTSFPNRYIPIALSLAGTVLYPVLLNYSEVVYNVRYDWLVSAMQGFAIGLGSSKGYDLFKEFKIWDIVVAAIKSKVGVQTTPPPTIETKP